MYENIFSNSRAPQAVPLKGRRIYIHGYSFANVVQRESAAAVIILGALLRTKAAKMINYHIVEDGAALGLLMPATQRELRHCISRYFEPHLTWALRRLGYRVPRPRLRSNVVRVLDDDESICASCYEDGYYTFATSERAARVMYMDQDSMSVVRQSMLAGRSADLTLINGRNLVLIRPEVGVGPGTAKYYSHVFSRKGARDDSYLRLVHAEQAGAVASEVKDLLAAQDWSERMSMGYLEQKYSLIIDALKWDLLN